MQDRRVRKTKYAIQNSLAKLLSQKDIRNITVKELCIDADINKSTFYLHYRDIYECADCFTYEIIEKINTFYANFSLAEIIENLPQILSNFLKIFYNNQELYLPFLKSPFLVSSLAIIRDDMIKNILLNASEKEKADPLLSYSVTFVVFGIIGILQHHNFEDITEETSISLANKIQNGFKCIYVD